MPVSSDGYICLRGGLCLPVDVILLHLGLEARGFSLTPDGDALIVRPFSQLTEEDKRRIRKWKLHLLALLAYEAPTCA